MKYLFYCCKYLYCEINESEMSKKKKKKKKKRLKHLQILMSFFSRIVQNMLYQR